MQTKKELAPYAKQSSYAVVNQFFDKVYVLTIPRNQARRAFLDQHLAGLEFEYFYGVDGQKLDQHIRPEDAYDLEAIRQHDHQIASKYLKILRQGPVLMNEVACALSHKNIYKDIIAKGYRNALILEDDVQVFEHNLKHLSRGLEQLPPDWDLVYLGYQLNFEFNWQGLLKKQAIRGLHGLGLRIPEVVHKYVSYPRPYSSNLLQAGVHTNAEAYGITQATARKLVEWQTPVRWIADHILMDACARRLLNAFLVYPKLFAQHGPSSIWVKSNP